MLRVSDHPIAPHSRLDDLEAAKMEQQPSRFASALIHHDSSGNASEKLARLGRMSEAPLLLHQRQHDRFGFGKPEEPFSWPSKGSAHMIPLVTKAEESVAAPKRYAPNVRTYFGRDESRWRDQPDLSSTELPKLTRNQQPSGEVDRTLHQRAGNERSLGGSAIIIADTKVTQLQRPSGTTQGLHPESNGRRIAQRALNPSRHAQNSGQKMRRREQQEFSQFQAQQKGLSNLNHTSNRPIFLQCSGACGVYEDVKSAINQLTTARKRRDAYLPTDLAEAERRVEELEGVLDDLKQHDDEYHERQRSPINLSSLLATMPSKRNGSNIFEKHEKQEFYLHHTISADRTGTNHEVATSILSVLGQRDRTPIFGQCAKGGDVTRQKRLDDTASMPPAVLFSLSQGSTDYARRSTLQSQRDEDRETHPTDFSKDSIAHFRQNWPGSTEQRLPTKPRSGHVLRPGDFLLRKDANDYQQEAPVSKNSDSRPLRGSEHPPHVTESILKTVHHNESGTLLNLPPICWHVIPDDIVPGPSRDCVLCKKRSAVTSFAWSGPGRGLLCPTCSEKFAHDDMPTEERWRNYRRKITSLFVDERRSCREIAVLMARQYNFSASEGAYLLLLKEWSVLQRQYSVVSFRIAKSIFQLEQDVSEDQDRSKHEQVRVGERETTTEAPALKNMRLPSQKTNTHGDILDEKSHRAERSPTKEDWEGYKSLIIHQYIHKDNNLRELKVFMEHVCCFKATDRMYKQRFATWQISKDRESSNNSVRRKMKEKCTFCQRDCVERARAAVLKQRNQQRMVHYELVDIEEHVQGSDH